MTKKAIIQFSEINRNNMPHYYDYAFTLEQVKQQLYQKTSMSFHIYTLEDGYSEIHSAMEQLLLHASTDIEIISPIYDHLHQRTVFLDKTKNYTIIPSAENNLFYFPEYQVAFANMAIFQAHADYPQEFIFAPDDQKALAFIQGIIDKERTFMQKGITVLTDTEDGLERSKEEITEQISREDVLLDDKIKTNIFRAIDEFFTDGGEFFKQYDIPYKRGILLYGNPGNGKTTLVKSIAESVDAPVMYWQITEFTSSYSIDEVFRTAKKIAPVILIIEDIDSMPHESRSVFLNTLDGATTKEGIFLIGTTNYPEKIDPALINRAGRFDRAYEIKQPNETLRRNYLIKKQIIQFVSEAELNDIAKKTRGLSIAQLNELYMSMALDWHYAKQVDVNRIIEELKEHQRRTWKQDWETEDDEGRLGF